MDKKELQTTALVILDGFGHSDKKVGNAVFAANMPHWKYFIKNYPNTLLEASGESVGLLPGFSGNSEVGHLTLGAGRIIESVLLRSQKAIDDGSFFENQILGQAFEELKLTGGRLHLMGLLSDGGVHSHRNMLYALMQAGLNAGIEKIYVHAFLDGRDVFPISASNYLNDFEKVRNDLSRKIKLASIQGRFFAMDRDENWDRTQEAYKVLTGQGKAFEISWQEWIERYYEQGITDEFIPPVLLFDEGKIRKGDGVVFFNIRPDRARQLGECFLLSDFNYFERENLVVQNNTLSFFITGASFDDGYKKQGCQVLFDEEKVYETLLDVLEKHRGDKKVFITAETEKRAHVTYFFKGLRDEVGVKEERCIVPSLKVSSYAVCPEMSAQTITCKVLEALGRNDCFFYLINYANADMVGHSGDFAATVRACEVLDEQLGVLYQEIVVKRGGVIFITADHGNAEQKIDANGKPLTAHTKNPVPFVIVGLENKKIKLEKNGLACVAPTILTYLQLLVPSVMSEPLNIEDR